MKISSLAFLSWALFAVGQAVGTDASEQAIKGNLRVLKSKKSAKGKSPKSEKALKSKNAPKSAKSAKSSDNKSAKSLKSAKSKHNQAAKSSKPAKSKDQSSGIKPTGNRDFNIQVINVTDSDFNIQIINMGPPGINPSLIEAFQWAAERWSKVIVGDVAPDFPAGTVKDWFSGQFPAPFDGAVDDVVIGFSIAAIDGPGRVLGRAGPIYVRIDEFGNALAPISGGMIFDAADVSLMPIDDFKVVVLHEIGHILGLIGITTNKCNIECSPNSTKPSNYACPLANAEYEALVPGASLKLENDGGAGTACYHWDEDSFKTKESSELMTGYFEEGKFQPLSLVTVAALEDLGVYEVDYSGADVWPATADAQRKFQVFVPSRTMDLDAMMVRLGPVAMINGDGKLVEMNTPLD